MEYAPIILATVALVLALLARSAASGQTQAIEDARSDARRRIENSNTELLAEIAKQREMIALLAGGAALSAEMVREGRLWRDAFPAEAAELFNAGKLRLVDVRSPQETAGGTLPGALLIPIDQFEGRMSEIPNDDKQTLIFCSMGGRSAAACELLSAEGRVGLLNLPGGIGAWSGPRE
jgi:rhodanese-related sulfurtransferase